MARISRTISKLCPARRNAATARVRAFASGSGGPKGPNRFLRANARAALRLSQAEAVPDVYVQFGYKRVVGFDTLMGGVEIPLPLWNRNKDAIAASTHEVRAAEAELAAQQALVRAEVQASSRELALRRREVAVLLPPLMTRAQENFRTALAGYRSGIADVHEVLDAQRNLVGLETQYYRSVGEYHRSRAALDYATGVRH